MLKRLFILLCASLLGVVGAAGQNLPEPMSPPRLVNDFVGLLTPEQQNALEQKLEAFDRKTSTQIAVVAVDDLDGYAPGDYAQRLYDKWGIGRKGKDNGILILVKPKTAASNGQVFISVGYGLVGFPTLPPDGLSTQRCCPNSAREIIMRVSTGPQPC